MATTLYHATPIETRASIRSHGLDLRYGKRLFLGDSDSPDELREYELHYPEGVYLIDSFAAAADHGCWHFDECDVWRVDMTGLHLALDRDLDGNPSGQSPHGGRAFFTFDAVPPERLELVGAALPGVWA